MDITPHDLGAVPDSVETLCDLAVEFLATLPPEIATMFVGNLPVEDPRYGEQHWLFVRNRREIRGIELFPTSTIRMVLALRAIGLAFRFLIDLGRDDGRQTTIALSGDGNAIVRPPHGEPLAVRSEVFAAAIREHAIVGATLAAGLWVAMTAWLLARDEYVWLGCYTFPASDGTRLFARTPMAIDIALGTLAPEDPPDLAPAANDLAVA